jgi:hypothetical protein
MWGDRERLGSSVPDRAHLGQVDVCAADAAKHGDGRPAVRISKDQPNRLRELGEIEKVVADAQSIQLIRYRPGMFVPG